MDKQGFESWADEPPYSGPSWTLPDLDSLFAGADPWTTGSASGSFSLSPVPSLVGHSVGWLGWRLFGKKGTVKDWVILACWGLMTHPLDSCTTYGTQLFAPFSTVRISWDTVGIIDPIYTLPLLIALGLGARKSVLWSGLKDGPVEH